ncbi:hypothetical protein ACIP4U_29680 [Streptomyces caelestis]|uniref:hypothetical protein n=1 Tax=Streptomyces caelestis TaxID=36816 RepID=UPI003813A4CF
MVALGAACALTFLASGTANAGTNSGFVYTTDWDPGGKGAFGHDGDCLTVYDDQSDGYAVEIHLFRMSDYKTIAELRTTQPALSHNHQCFGSQVPRTSRSRACLAHQERRQVQRLQVQPHHLSRGGTTRG